MSRITVNILNLQSPVTKAYFLLPKRFEADLIKEDENCIVVKYGQGNYCFKTGEVMYLIHDELLLED